MSGVCGMCGNPMPPGEEMFRYHGLSGPCPPSLDAPAQSPPAGIQITVNDLETGDTETQVIHPGEHAVICVEPAYRSAVQVYPNGTTQITIRKRGGAA